MKNLDWLLNTPIAHRGLHNNELPENSMGAFAAAVDKGFNIEIDVHQSSDGKIVVFHDFDLRRMCQIDKKVSEMTCEELTSTSLKGTKETIPTLEEFLKAIDGKVGLLIEIKFKAKASGDIAQKVYNMIKDYKGNVAIQSFSPIIVYWYRKHAPEVLRGLLATNYEDLNVPNAVRLGLRAGTRVFMRRIIKRIRPDFISYNILSFPNKVMNRFKNEKMPFLTWTINKPELVAKSKEYADNIIFERIEITEF